MTLTIESKSNFSAVSVGRWLLRLDRLQVGHDGGQSERRLLESLRLCGANSSHAHIGAIRKMFLMSAHVYTTVNLIRRALKCRHRARGAQVRA